MIGQHPGKGNRVAPTIITIETMPYIIDGHNLIPQIPGLSLEDIDDEIELIKLLQDFCRQHRSRADVYFDNAPPGSSRSQKHGPVTAHFTSKGYSADSAIRSRLRKIGRSARNYTVITSDRAVAAAAKEAGARVITSQDFTRHLSLKEGVEAYTPELDPDLRLKPEELSEWIDVFGIKDEEE
jgi:predicted RNA-binding protein with PIN domain